MIYKLAGDPIALQRPRVLRSGYTYNPQAQEQEEARIQLRLQHHSSCPILTPLSISITFFMPIPKSTPKKKRSKLVSSPHSKRPDIDNLIKFVLDAANSIIFYDDSLVYSVTAQKIYDTIPRTEFTIIPLEE